MNRHHITLFGFFLICQFNCLAFAITSSDGLNQAEMFVLEQLEKGEIADLSKFPEDGRILRADFLEQLLTGSLRDLKITEKGININKAQIEEKLILSKTKISFPVSFKVCNFNREVAFNLTVFAEHTDFSGATFSSAANFSGAKFSEESHFSEVHFSKQTDFSGATFSSAANFSGAKFSEESHFSEVHFSKQTDFSGATFSSAANFSGAKFFLATFFIKASLKGANLRKAYLREVYLSGADLSEADLGEADLSRAYLDKTNLSRANLREANLKGANLRDANLSEANLIRAILGDTDFSRADLSKTFMNEAILKEAFLSETNLSGANLRQADLTGAFFDLKPKSLPEIQHLAFARNLSELTYNFIPRSLVELREQFKTAGLRRQEREITYAIRRTERKKLLEETNWVSKIEGGLKYGLFEWTCKYGMEHFRPLLILIFLIIFFTIPYMIFLKFPPKRDGIWKSWSPDRVRKDLGSQEPIRLNLNLNLNFLPAIRISLYFSLLSAFGIGWRELNFGNWIARLHPREYTIRATGWVKTVSGFQSLISVYLLALWVLIYFGRPFDSF